MGKPASVALRDGRNDLLGARFSGDVADSFRELCDRADTTVSTRIRQLILLDLFIDTMGGLNADDEGLALAETMAAFRKAETREPFDARKEAMLAMLIRNQNS